MPLNIQALWPLFDVVVKVIEPACKVNCNQSKSEKGGHASGRSASRGAAKPDSSSPHPWKRRTSGVSLLPSGPGPVPPANTADSPSGQPDRNRRPSRTGTLRSRTKLASPLSEPSLGFGPRISTVSGYRGRRTPRPSPPCVYHAMYY